MRGPPAPSPDRNVDPFVHNIDPFIFRIGDGFGVRWYSIPYMLGMLFVYLSLRKAAAQRRIAGLTEENSESFVIMAIALALVGARFFHVFVFEFDRYGFDPVAWVAVWRGGLAFHGGLLGVVLAVYIFGRQHGIRMYDLTDRIAAPVAVALGFGRIANFINAEMYGTLYDGPFCVDYSQSQYMGAPPEGCRHPVQLYESAKNFVLAGILLGMREKLRPRPGVVTWTFIGGYGVIRFFLMFVREERIVAAGLTLAQFFSAGMAILGAVMLVVVMTTEPPRERTTPGVDGPVQDPGAGESGGAARRRERRQRRGGR
ncbi:MAG: prolipoprotein diacylglyceryl transferase [Gemmatimonadales bacterium]|nr:MAG: prolipoprotein diacylglyceryl transferase [Gemmatimonadales bacterium]